MTDQEGPKIQIDSDWKAEAQREKQRLAEQEKAKQGAASDTAAGAAAEGAPGGAAPGASARGAGQIPPASFQTLVAMLATQALLYTGGIADPQTGQPMVHLDLARHHIDLLGVLEEKCKGNLSEEEEKTLATTVYELRGRYVQVANASRQK